MIVGFYFHDGGDPSVVLLAWQSWRSWGPGTGCAWWGNEEIIDILATGIRNTSVNFPAGHFSSTCKFECCETGCVFLSVFSADRLHRLVTCLSQCSCFDQWLGHDHWHDGPAEDPSAETDFTVKPSGVRLAMRSTLRVSQRKKLQPCLQS